MTIDFTLKLQAQKRTWFRCPMLIAIRLPSDYNFFTLIPKICKKARKKYTKVKQEGMNGKFVKQNEENCDTENEEK